MFEPQRRPVALVGGAPGTTGRLALFSARLRVNTDGAPNSYHPDDPSGERLAINNILNGIAVRNADNETVGGREAIQAFIAFRDNKWVNPPGLTVSWQSVIAARQFDGRTVPCVFQTGAFQGYFGSLTALQNGLPASAAGECDVNNQLDERFIPALVMAGASDGKPNPLQSFGARLGDLVVAVNPQNGNAVAAVVGDVGPPDNLGEGSVALNMGLLGRTEQPRTYTEAKQLDTGPQQITVAVLPGTRGFQAQRPYSRDNIRARVEAWAAANGYGSLDGLVRQIRACEPAVSG
jgi:hypothetical protein